MKHITTEELRNMKGNEGLIIQGCGGDLDEWLDGINELLTEREILLDGDTFKDVFVFENEGHTNMLFIMNGVNLDVGKLAMWRLQTRDKFGGYWLSDYIPNVLGSAPAQRAKPSCPLIGADGNVFNLVGIASRTLKRNGMTAEATEMTNRVFASKSYDEALAIMTEYVEPTSADEMDMEQSM